MTVDASPPGRLPRPRVGVRLLVFTLAVALTGTTAVAQEPDASEITEELEQANEALDQARSQQAAVGAQVGGAQAQLAEADSRLIALTEQLRAREDELATATEQWEAATARTAESQVRLDRVTARLATVRERLEADQDRFGARVSAAYKHGGHIQMAEVLLASDDFSDLVQTGYLVQSVLEGDKDLVDRVADQTRRIAAERGEVDQLTERLATQQASADRARREVERATAVQRELTEAVAAERANRQAVLGRLEADLVTYTQLVTAYEAESARLEEELANARWQAAAPGKGGLLWPTDGRAGSGYGYRTHPIFGTRRMHAGVDIAGPTGQPIIAASAGQVVSAGWRGGYGMAVVIDHGGGIATLYAHQSRILVTAGQVVDAGQQVGEIGSTGQSTGPHLHYEIRQNGSPVDPMNWY